MHAPRSCRLTLAQAGVSLAAIMTAIMTAKTDIQDMLERYNCPHTVAVVRMRFWGAINSPAAHISPIEEIDHLWRGKMRRFENADEAQAFYDVIIRFWNSLAENRTSGKPVAFAVRSGLKTIDGLKSAIASRHVELDDGFFSGFIGNLRRDDPVDSRISDNLDKLTNVIEEIEDLLERPIGPSNANKIRSRFVALDKRAQKLVNQLVMQTWVAARGSQTMH